MSSAGVSILAFFIDWLATLANQVSFAVQKSGHMDQEKKKQTVSSDQTIESTMFCSWKGIAGLGLTIVGIIGHTSALPFCDLTLIACNSSSAILINMFISKKYLGEKFIAKYDVTAAGLVSLGTLAIILMSNKDQQTFPVDRLLAVLTSF